MSGLKTLGQAVIRISTDSGCRQNHVGPGEQGCLLLPLSWAPGSSQVLTACSASTRTYNLVIFHKAHTGLGFNSPLPCHPRQWAASSLKDSEHWLSDLISTVPSTEELLSK